MKHGKRFLSLALALVMVFSLTTGASAAPAPETVQVNINHSMAVAYNGRIQSMKDANGNKVDPILNGGTTYLPVRAVGDMLGLDVDWDQATRTVILSDPADGPKDANRDTGSFFIPKTKPDLEAVTVSLNPGITVTYNGKVQTLKDTNGNTVYPMLYGGTTYLPVRAVGSMLGLVVDWNQAMQTVLLGEPDYADKYGAYDEQAYLQFIDGKTLTLGGYIMYMTEQGAGKAEIDAFFADLRLDQEVNEKFDSGEWVNYKAEEYSEIDTTTANEGYIRFKWTKQVSDGVDINVICGDKRYSFSRAFDEQMLDTWLTVSLPYGSGDYSIKIHPIYDKTKNGLEKYEKYGCRGNTLFVNVTADIADPDAALLMSNLHVDYENAPKARAKALELTKNCKTDAEKITAVFEYVARTISSDHALVEAEHAAMIDAALRDLNLDHILDSRKGVCEHYAVLMAGMLRSIGVPCKYVGGEMYADGEWCGHAWVAVKPETGNLNLSALGAGKDGTWSGKNATGDFTATGWIRLDPTWGGTISSRAAAANDRNYIVSGYE